jgi:hypothetical protein
MDSSQNDTPGDGLVYYMPNKDFIVTVVRDVAKTSVTIESSAAYPDLSLPFVLNFNRNFIGKNEIKVGVGESGLLTSAKSTTTSGISDVLKNLAASIGAANAMVEPANKDDCPVGTFSYLLEPASGAIEKELPCGLKLTIRPARKPLGPKGMPLAGDDTPKGRQGTGIFYRQEEPYLVQVAGGSGVHQVNVAAIKYSPSRAATRFLPIARTVFASNQAEFGFTDGMPTKYDQNADGELIGLLKLPADVVGSYFEAAGKVFTGFKQRDDNEAAALVAETQLEMAKVKFAACVKALQNKDDQLVRTLECGQ